MYIKNDMELQQYLIKEIQRAISNVSENITKSLWKNISNDIYSKPTSKYYERTNQFLNSIISPNVKVSNNSVSVEIGMNYRAMKPMYGGEGMFNKHMGFRNEDSWRGMEVGEALLSWWDYGTDNSYFPSLPRTDYWYDVMGDRGYDPSPNYTKLNKMIEEEIAKELSKFGKIIK